MPHILVEFRKTDDLLFCVQGIRTAQTKKILVWYEFRDDPFVICLLQVQGMPPKNNILVPQ